MKQTQTQINKLIESYLTAHTLAWAPTTLRSERARLNAVAHLIPQGAAHLYEQKQATLKPYALKTLFIRLADFELHVNKPWGYRQFMQENARLFKHVYTREAINVSKDNISTLLSQLGSDSLVTLGFAVLRNGLRISELQSYDKASGMVVGKGGRARRLLAASLLPDNRPSAREVADFRAALKKVGLKPHTLRKAAATLLARGGMQSQDLLHVMGWSSLQTAVSYLQPQQDDKLAAFANNVLGG